MTREEAIYRLRNLKAMAIRDKYIMPNSGWAFDLGKILDLLQQPPTLADFLGWEEGQEYEYRTGAILMLDNEKIYYKSDGCSSGWCNYNFFGNEIEDLRQAKKVEEPKFYAKIKGWEVFEDDDGYYWNYDEDDKWFFIASKYGTERTKSQWAELGVDEDNAEFELVEVE